MPETASPPLAAEPTAVDDDVISPELVLVDPGLRDRLASLPPPEPRVTSASAPADEPAPVVETVPPPAATSAAAPLRVAEPTQLTPPALPPPVPVPVERSRPRRWPVFVAVLVGGALALAATIAFLPRGKSTPETARVVDPSSTGHIGRPASSTSEAHVTAPVTPATQSTPARPTTAPPCSGSCNAPDNDPRSATDDADDEAQPEEDRQAPDQTPFVTRDDAGQARLGAGRRRNRV